MVFGGLFKPNIENMRNKKNFRGLVRALKYKKDWTVRSEAAKALGSIGPDAREAIPPLEDVLMNDRVSTVLENAASALGKIDASYLVEVWGKILRLDYFPSVPEGWSNYWAIRKVLITMGSNAVTFLSEALKDKNEVVRRHTINLLGEIGPDAREALPALLEALSDEAQEEAIDALGKIGKEAVPFLVKALRYGRIDVKIRATRSLGIIGPEAKEAVPALIEVFKKEDMELRIIAAEALGGIGPDAKDSVHILIETLKEKEIAVLPHAAKALRKIAPERVAKEGVPTLIKRLNDDKLWVRVRANEYGAWEEQMRIIVALGEFRADSAEAYSTIESVLTHHYSKYWEDRVSGEVQWVGIDYSGVPKDVMKALDRMGYFFGS